MASEQDWCLECGAAVKTRVQGPPSWRVPLIAVIAALALLAAVVLGTLALLSDDADDEASRASAGRPAAASPQSAPTREGRTTETVPGAEEAAGGGPVALWPANREAYTVVLASASNRRAAEERAREAIRQGEDAGILRTDDYDFFEPGAWFVWAGQYADRAAAERAAQGLQERSSGAYITLVRRKTG